MLHLGLGTKGLNHSLVIDRVGIVVIAKVRKAYIFSLRCSSYMYKCLVFFVKKKINVLELQYDYCVSAAFPTFNRYFDCVQVKGVFIMITFQLF